MKCPDCDNKLQVSSCRGIIIHECRSCKGKWFERDELKRVKDKTDEGLRWIDFDPFGLETESKKVPSQGKFCPGCHNGMALIRYMHSDVVIDKCCACKGVWLSSGELRKIIAYLEHLIKDKETKTLAKDTFRKFIEVFSGRKDMAAEIQDLFAVFYLLELKISIEHPDLTLATQKIYEAVPFI